MSAAHHTLTRRAVCLGGLMAGCALLGQSLVPSRRLAQLRGPFKLEEMIPTAFGAWKVPPYAFGGVVNPQAKALADQIYSQQVDRVYLDEQGRAVMLSVAYSEDVSTPASQVHYPEVCYPAQGFKVMSSDVGRVETDAGRIHVRRLQTALPGRPEPLTYWTMVGNQQSLGGWDKRLAELRHGFRGEIVDGLVFRVSCVDPDTPRAYALQERFIQDMAKALTPQARLQLMGL